ncbi:selenoprotein S-like [Uloborus diversus]|uniref:selenoprotein S-like n=1 Tax=Uloborus diversus TaxID=327109 RepID=UPI00240A7FF4|nr:selenoprotein S-like [Uloborus diversus]
MVNMEVPPNATPEPVENLFTTILSLLSAYGWTILFVIVVLNLLWSHFHPKYKKWRDQKEDREKEQVLQQNPELILERQEALARARQKLQEEHDRLNKEYEEKIRQKEEMKRQEKIANFERIMGKQNTTGGNDKSLNLRRNDYAPLMGSGPTCSYRPSRRGTSGGG